MKINGVVCSTSRNIYRSKKREVLSYTKNWFNFFKKKEGLVDCYNLIIDFDKKIGELIQFDDTDYGLSSYAESASDFDTNMEFDLTDKSDLDIFKDKIKSIFGGHSEEFRQIEGFKV